MSLSPIAALMLFPSTSSGQAQTGDEPVCFLLPTAEGIFGPAEEEAAAETQSFDTTLTFSEQKKAWEAEFEKKYLAWLLARADGSLSAAARMARMDRKHLRNLAKKHGLWRG